MCRYLLPLAASFLLLLASPRAEAQFTRFANYSEDQGLENLDVTSIAQDASGYILLGTQGGLYRFDGATIAAFGDLAGLSSDWIRQIAIDPAGRVWVVARDGVFVGKGPAFRKLGDGRHFLDMESPHLLAFDRTGVVVDDGGTLLSVEPGIKGPDRLGPFLDRGTLRATPDLRHARFVVADGGRGLLVGCGEAVCDIVDRRVSIIGRDAGLPADRWEFALRTADGTLWIRSVRHLAWRRPADRTFRTVDVPGQTSDYYVGSSEDLTLVADAAGNIYTQSTDGLLMWSGLAWHAMAHHEGGLPTSPIAALAVDREGSLWVGSDGRGAFRSIGLGRWQHWTTEDGLPGDVAWSTVRLSSGQFWVATYGGTAPVGLSGTGPATAAARRGVIPGADCALAKTRDGRLWVAPFGAPLARVDPIAGTVDRIRNVGTVRTAFVDPSDRLWLSTRTGLVLLRDADAPIGSIRPETMLAEGVRKVVADPSGTVWVAAATGLFRLDADTKFRLVVPASLVGSFLDDMDFAGDGVLWVASGGSGIRRFRVNGAAVTQLPTLRPPVISSDNVMSVFRDRRNWMWVGTDRGLDMFDGHGWHRFDSTGGLITDDLDSYGAYEDLDGSMWFSTTRGLSHYLDPGHEPGPAVLHPVVTGVSLDGRPLPFSARLGIGWTPDPLSIRFADLDYAQGSGIAFRYRLLGVDRDWNETTIREVRYARLPAGRLRFELMAIDKVHGSTSPVTGFTIRVHAPWWCRWWFHGICLLLAVAAIVGLCRLRVRLLLRQQQRLEAEQQRLERLVAARTAEIEQARSELQRLAMSDALTALPNRRAIMEALGRSIGTAREAAEPFGVLLCDVDHFKRINDTGGHLVGDQVLSLFGGRLASAIRAGESAGRYGGEEFLVMLPGSPDAVGERAEAIQAEVTGLPFLVAPVEQVVTSSGGLAFYRAGDDAVSLLARADAALYAAKQRGRDRIVREDERSVTEPSGQSEAALKRDLRIAMARDEFVLHYQPILDDRLGRIVAYEALLRWRARGRDIVSPAEFIPFAERSELMPEIDDWVIRAACREASRWPEDIRIAINLSPSHFGCPDLVGTIEAALAETGLDPRRLELEVTETAMVADAEAAACLLRRLRARGVSVALDDFGTGYSSFGLLRALPVDRIKIDRSFVADLGVRPEATAIIGSVVHLGSAIGAAVTAEGVETAAQVEMLRAIGCHELQGFWIGHPEPLVRSPFGDEAIAGAGDLVTLDA